MNILDYVLIAILLFFFIFGYFKGFVIQALGIIGVGLAFYLAARFHRPLAEMPLFEGVREQNPSAALVVGFVLIFFVVAALTSVVTLIIGRKVKHTAVRPADKWFGGLLALTKAVLLLGGLAVALQEYGFPMGAVVPGRLQEVPEQTDGVLEKAVSGSLLVPYLAEGCLIAVRLVPKETREEVAQIYRGETREILGGEPAGGQQKAAGGDLTSPLVPDGTSKTSDALRPLVPEASDGTAPVARKSKPGRPASAPSDQLIDLGQWRQIVVEEKAAMSRPVPATGGDGEDARPVPSTSKQDQEP